MRGQVGGPTLLWVGLVFAVFKRQGEVWRESTKGKSVGPKNTQKRWLGGIVFYKPQQSHLWSFYYRAFYCLQGPLFGWSRFNTNEHADDIGWTSWHYIQKWRSGNQRQREALSHILLLLWQLKRQIKSTKVLSDLAERILASIISRWTTSIIAESTALAL